MSRNALTAETGFVSFRFQAESRRSASAPHASSTEVKRSLFISAISRSTNRSRSDGESFQACFSIASVVSHK